MKTFVDAGVDFRRDKFSISHGSEWASWGHSNEVFLGNCLFDEVEVASSQRSDDDMLVSYLDDDRHFQ
jgi:hypothetical protein